MALPLSRVSPGLAPPAVLHEALVALAQRLPVHLRHKVDGPIDIISGRVAEQTTLAVQPLVKLGAGHGLQQADHCRDDPALLNELDLALKYCGRVVIESDDKPALHLQAHALDAFHVRDQVAAMVTNPNPRD